MPKKYVPKFKRGRKYRRRYRRRNNMLSLTKAPIPNKFATKLRYAESFAINPTAGVPGIYIFSANGCYDPNYTGTGHQPRGFDQFMAMYDHFTVIGSKITATFGHLGETVDESVVVGINLRDSTSAPSDKNDYMEGRNVVSKMLVGGKSGDSKQCTLHKAFSTKKYLGLSKPLSSSVARGSASGNPGEQAWYHLWAAATNLADLGFIQIQVVIDYLVVFTEPKQPGQS